MIREFDLRDLALVRRLAPEGLCLHTQTGLTRGIHNLLDALRAYVAPGSHVVTLVSRPHEAERAMFGQVRLSRDNSWGQVFYLAPRLADALLDDWVAVLEQLAAGAAARGAQYLVAQIDDDSPEREALRRVGFSSYAHQRIWKLGSPTTVDLSPALRVHQHSDRHGIYALYQQIVPRLIQQIEPPPDYEEGFVWMSGEEIVVYFGVARGPLGVWLRPYLHPLAQTQIDGLLAALLYELGDVEVPVYACVHSYQGGLQGALEVNGFEPVGYQAIMVKRLSIGVMSPEFTDVKAVDARKIATGPLAKLNFEQSDQH